VFEPRDDNFGIAVLSRRPLLSAEVLFLGTGGLPSIRADVEHGGQTLTVVATPPIPPINEFATGVRDAQLTAIAEMISQLDHAAVLVGDFNDSPWSPTFRDLIRVSGMESAARGLRSLYTWPVGLVPLFVQLDHCLHTPELAAHGFKVLASIGADHYPIECRLSVESD
jgi:endonuclease/exonuclease/phosphatase (EEP) superfamily protein YafD